MSKESKALLLYEKYCCRCKYTKSGEKCSDKFLELFKRISTSVKAKYYNEDVLFRCFKERK